MTEIERISSELQKMAEEDQLITTNPNTTKAEAEKIHIKHLPRLKEIINQYGLITINKFGKQTSHTAWMLVQHVPKEEMDFKEKYLNLMEAHLNDVDTKDFAFLKDKILVQKGKKQIYGTQLQPVKDSTLNFFDIEDIGNIDLRRSEVGLESLSNYVAKTANFWKVEVRLPENY